MDLSQFQFDARQKLPPQPKLPKPQGPPPIRIPEVQKKHIKRDGKKQVNMKEGVQPDVLVPWPKEGDSDKFGATHTVEILPKGNTPPVKPDVKPVAPPVIVEKPQRQVIFMNDVGHIMKNIAHQIGEWAKQFSPFPKDMKTISKKKRKVSK